MKALLCLEFGPLEGLALEEVSSPIAGNGQVVVAVNAAGVVKQVGEGVTGLKVGDAVLGVSMHGASFCFESSLGCWPTWPD